MRWLLIISIVFFVAVPAAAATDDFVVSVLIGSDTTPPTTPTNLSATPITTSQIDLAWDASTDDLLMGGYQVFRDSSQIATTTLTTYTDSGLTPDTLYSYEIVAFDTAPNYSSSSLPAATTTLASTTPATTTTTGRSGGGSIKPTETIVENLLVSTTNHQAAISFDTNVYTRATLRWGRTVNYELGYIASEIYKQHHETVITDLEPGTLYELEITLERRFAGEPVVRWLQFTTEALPDTTAPPNVTDLQAQLIDGEVELSWNNPSSTDFSHVRIQSSDRWFPRDPHDGWFIYEGADGTVLDYRSVTTGVRYYSVFTYDENGNRSSGAVVSVTTDTESVGQGPSPESSDIDYYKEPPQDISDSDQYQEFDFADIAIVQAGQDQTLRAGVITLDQDKSTTFTIPYEELPEHLKSVIVTLINKANPELRFSFLLSINSDRNAYEAVVGPLSQIGEYEVVVGVYDYRAQTVVRRTGELTVVASQAVTPIQKVKTIVRINWPLIIALASGFLLLLTIWLYRSFRSA